MIIPFKNKYPTVKENNFLAENSTVIGNVFLNENSSVWFGAVLRGDVNFIKIGRFSNIQDNAVIHANKEQSGVTIGDYVTVGHGAILHGCTIENNVLIGMGATVLDGALIGSNTIIGAGSIVPPKKKIPEGVLCVGSPAKIIRNLTLEEIDKIKENAVFYNELASQYKGY